MALRFLEFLGTTAKFWLGLQNDYDLEEEKLSEEEEFASIKPVAK